MGLALGTLEATLDLSAKSDGTGKSTTPRVISGLRKRKAWGIVYEDGEIQKRTANALILKLNGQETTIAVVEQKARMALQVVHRAPVLADGRSWPATPKSTGPTKGG